MLDAAMVSLSEYIFYGSIFVFTILISRYYGTQELGYFSFALALSTLLVYSMNGAFSAILKRDIAIRPGLARIYVGSFLMVRVVLSIVLGLGLILLLLPFIQTSQLVTLTLIYLTKAIEGLSEVHLSLFQASSRMGLYALLRSLGQLFFLGVCFAAMASGSSPQQVYLVGMSNTILFYLLISFIGVRSLSGKLSYRKKLVRYALVQSWPLLVNAFAFALSARFGILSATFLEGPTSSGIYAAGQNVINGIGLLPSAVGIVLFPELSRMFMYGLSRVWSYVLRAGFVLLVLGTFFLIGLLSLAQPILDLYGELPSEAIRVFSILCLAVPFMFAQPPFGYAYTAIHRQREGMFLSLGTLIVSLPLYLLFTNLFGIYGTSWAFVLHQSVFLLGSSVLLFILSKSLRKEGYLP